MFVVLPVMNEFDVRICCSGTSKRPRASRATPDLPVPFMVRYPEVMGRRESYQVNAKNTTEDLLAIYASNDYRNLKQAR